MCGICGIINFDSRPVAKYHIQRMMNTMKHRGPDDEGIFIDKNIGLGHVRLSILDLSSAGHQPMFSDDSRYCIIFNGEIYNYLELQKELSSNSTFKTKTDTEVIINAYRHWGEECLNHFNGMFAFAIYDKKNKFLFIARDRFGIKPFYYYQDKNKLIFASDIPPILSILNKRPRANKQSIYDYLIFNRTNHTENTFFKDIKKLQHSHALIIKDSNIKIKRWYSLPEKILEPIKNKNEFVELMKSSVDLRLRSDVPVGACLSGGLDSSSIVSIILKYFNKPDLHTFSAIYEKGMRGDESLFIEEYNTKIYNMHFTKPTANSFYNDINRFVEALVEPVPGTSEYAEFKVMELAKKNCTVLLNGQGVDEILAGYLYFFGFFYKELFYKFRFIKLLHEIYYDIKNHHKTEGIASFIFFLLPPFLKNKINILLKNYLEKDFFSKYSGDSSFLNNLYGSKTLHQALVNHFEYKFEHHLIWADRSGMWFSLETRFPFLDHHFVEKALALSNDQLIQKGETKYIMRQAMKNILPEKIHLRQDKVGYETPENDWFRERKIADFFWQILGSSKFRNRGIIDPIKAKRLYKKHLNGKINIGTEIWKWINLELWFRKYID